MNKVRFILYLLVFGMISCSTRGCQLKCVKIMIGDGAPMEIFEYPDYDSIIVTRDNVQTDIKRISENEPLLGRKLSDHQFYIIGAPHDSKNTITIRTEEILFKRNDLNSKWYLTSESESLIKERLAVAFVQYKLRAKDYPIEKIDGILGPKTESILKRFQREHGIDQTGIIDEKTLQVLSSSN